MRRTLISQLTEQVIDVHETTTGFELHPMVTVDVAPRKRPMVFRCEEITEARGGVPPMEGVQLLLENYGGYRPTLFRTRRVLVKATAGIDWLHEQSRRCMERSQMWV